MAKLEKQYPDFECVEYDYGDLDRRKYYGTIHASIKFADGVDIFLRFDFKDFLDFHKRKRTNFYRIMETTYANMGGWGSRYFELIELLQEEDEIDLFELFCEYIELTQGDFAEKYESRRYKIQAAPKRTPPAPSEEQKLQEVTKNKKEIQSILEEEEEEEEESPYDSDRKKFYTQLKQASNDMYDALKINFFPQMEYFQRRYPSRWKTLTDNLEIFLQNFEDEMLHEMLPELDEDEYREFDIKYNSQKADMSDEDEPPTAR